MTSLVRRRMAAASHATVASPEHTQTNHHWPCRQDVADIILRRSHRHEQRLAAKAPKGVDVVGPLRRPTTLPWSRGWHRTLTMRVIAATGCERRRKARPDQHLRESRVAGHHHDAAARQTAAAIRPTAAKDGESPSEPAETSPQRVDLDHHNADPAFLGADLASPERFRALAKVRALRGGEKRKREKRGGGEGVPRHRLSRSPPNIRRATPTTAQAGGGGGGKVRRGWGGATRVALGGRRGGLCRNVWQDSAQKILEDTLDLDQVLWTIRLAARQFHVQQAFKTPTDLGSSSYLE
jgi:hypothetical protein